MGNQCFWYLEDADLQKMMDPKKSMEIRDQLIHRKFKKSEKIYMPDDAADKIFFVMEGRVKISSTGEEGKEVTKIIINQGEIFGELALVGEAKRRDHATALEQTTLCVMSLQEMQSIMKSQSSISMFIMKILGSRVVDMEKRLESLVFRDSRTRIIEFILDLVEKKGQRVGYEMVVRKFLTHQEIANMTATSRQTVTTVLNDLRSKNLLTFDRKRLLVRDVENLEKEKTLA